MIRPRRALVLFGTWFVGVLAAFPLAGSAAQSTGTPAASPRPQQELRAPGSPPARPAPEQEQLAPGMLAPRPVPQQKLRAEPLRPAPQTIREKWGIRVFLAWLWFTTGVLLYLFRRLVREADRVHGLGYSTPRSRRPKKCEPKS